VNPIGKSIMTRRKSTIQKSRFTLWLPSETTGKLVHLQEVLQKASVAEVVRDAIDVYANILEARDNGVELFFRKEGTQDEGPVWVLPGPFPKGNKRK
jgi:hypothetical protein